MSKKFDRQLSDVMTPDFLRILIVFVFGIVFVLSDFSLIAKQITLVVVFITIFILILNTTFNEIKRRESVAYRKKESSTFKPRRKTMSVFSKLSKEDKVKVFSGVEVPKEWIPSGTWDEGADYLCFVQNTRWAEGSYKFVKGETKNTVKAVRV